MPPRPSSFRSRYGPISPRFSECSEDPPAGIGGPANVARSGSSPRGAAWLEVERPGHPGSAGRVPRHRPAALLRAKHADRGPQCSDRELSGRRDTLGHALGQRWPPRVAGRLPPTSRACPRGVCISARCFRSRSALIAWKRKNVPGAAGLFAARSDGWQGAAQVARPNRVQTREILDDLLDFFSQPFQDPRLRIVHRFDVQ